MHEIIPGGFRARGNGGGGGAGRDDDQCAGLPGEHGCGVGPLVDVYVSLKRFMWSIPAQALVSFFGGFLGSVTYHVTQPYLLYNLSRSLQSRTGDI